MKKLLSIALIVLLAVVFTAGGALAVSFDFVGGFTLTDADQDGFAEVLNLNASEYTPNKSPIFMFDPSADTVLDYGSYVLLSEFTLDNNSYSSGDYYDFANNPYNDGFEVYDSNDNLLLQADITLDPLAVDGGTASINSSFGMNLTNIDVFVAGSPILDAFAAAPGGAVNFTFNIAGYRLATMIENGGGKGGYSGSAAPTPEPGTLLLLGVGLLGGAFYGRRKRNS